MKKKAKKQTEKSTGMAALADGNMGSFMQSALFDPNGCWTGTPYVGMMDPDVLQPEQDVDDL